MAFNQVKKIEVSRRVGNDKRDGNGKFNDEVLMVEVVEAEATDKFAAKMFFSVGFFEEAPDGKLYPAKGKTGSPKKLIGAEHLAETIRALQRAHAQLFGSEVPNGGPVETEGEDDVPVGGDDGDDNIPF